MMTHPAARASQGHLDSLHLYRAELAHCIHLTSSEEVASLIVRIAQAQAGHDQEAERTYKHQLVETYLPLVMALAARHRPHLRRLAWLDLIQEGNIGLLRAVNSYDYAHHPGKGFTTYVRVAIRHALADALFLDDGITISPDVFYKQRAAFQQQGAGQDAFRDQLRRLQPLSLERPFITERGERSTLLEQLVQLPALSPDEETPARQHALIEQWLGVLTPGEQQIIHLYYGLDPTVACEPGYSGVVRYYGGSYTVGSLRARALRKLRALVALPPKEQQRVIEQKRQKYARLAARESGEAVSEGRKRRQ
jgi:RNA polymerase sigma factor (sigma-70 family)